MHGFVNLRRIRALEAFDSLPAIRARFNLEEVAESSYEAPGMDQMRLAGAPEALERALGDPDIAAAARDLAEFLITGTCVYAKAHNPYLTAAVMRPTRPRHQR